jgi:hypothetical protein
MDVTNGIGEQSFAFAESIPNVRIYSEGQWREAPGDLVVEVLLSEDGRRLVHDEPFQKSAFRTCRASNWDGSSPP